MTTGLRWAGPIAAVILAALTATPAAADGVMAVETDGSGVLTMCRSQLVYTDCNDYNHIAIPRRIAVGDKVPVTFGSNPKDYSFPVVRIVKNGVVCTLLSETDDGDKVNKIKVSSCRDVSDPH